MPEIATQQQNTSPTSFFRKIKKLLDIIIIPIVLLLVILCILAWAPWVTDSFAREKALPLLGSSCKELKQEEYEEYGQPVILAILIKPTLRERLGLEPLFGNNITLYLLCDGKGKKNEYFVSFYGSTELVSSVNVTLFKEDSKKDETTDWKTYIGESNNIKFSLKYPPTFFDTGFQWTSSPGPDPEAAGFDNVEGQQPGATGSLVKGEIRLAIKALTEEESKLYGERIGIARTIEKPTSSATFAGLNALKYSGREPVVEESDYQSVEGRVMYYVNNQPPVDANYHFIFECIFNPYTDTSLEETCETIASTFKFLD